MAAPFMMDGKAYNFRVPSGGLKRSFQVLDGDNAGRVLAGDMDRDVIGTFYNYEVTITPVSTDLNEYDAFYEEISAPVDFHLMTFPYGQSTLTFQAYVTAGADTIIKTGDGATHWRGLSVQFIAKSPQRTP